jgi:antitoxin component YwqK of YwqJK toxin-antitoxin module
MERILKLYGEIMVKNIILFTFTLMLIYTNVTGCQEQVKEDNNKDLRYTYHKNGKIESETEYVNGVRHGKRTFYDELGNLYSEGTFVNDSREGAMKIYYPDGSLKMSGNYVNNVLEGEVFSYFPNGKLESKKLFENGEMIYNIKYTIDGDIEYEDKF